MTLSHTVAPLRAPQRPRQAAPRPPPRTIPAVAWTHRPRTSEALAQELIPPTIGASLFGSTSAFAYQTCIWGTFVAWDAWSGIVDDIHHRLPETTVYTNHGLHQTTIFTNRRLHQATAYTNHHLHQTTVYTNHRFHSEEG